MEPSKKSVDMKDFLDAVSKDMFGRGRTESIKSDICVDCGLAASHFKDQKSMNEYRISGLCQACQDKIWG